MIHLAGVFIPIFVVGILAYAVGAWFLLPESFFTSGDFRMKDEDGYLKWRAEME